MVNIAYANNLGVLNLPLEYNPGKLKKILGALPFVIEANGIRILDHEPIDYNDIISVSANSVYLEILNRNNSVFRLNCGFKAKKFAELIEIVKNENSEYAKYSDELETVDLNDSFVFVKNILEFRTLPYVRAVNFILKIAIVKNLSDIHFEPTESNEINLTVRQSGQIIKVVSLEKHKYERLVARLKYLSKCLSHVDDIAQEGSFKHSNIDVRLSTFPTDNGERISLRIINTIKFLSLNSLGWSDKQASIWLDSIKCNRGLYIISGRVGSGKTTAMYSSLYELSILGDHLRAVTIEDPVESFIPGICQASLSSMKEKSLANAFKHILRQDPNIIALGEIRDSNCVKEVLQASLSGHLIFATFHAGSIDETVARLKQMSSDENIVLAGLKGILHLELKREGQVLCPEVHFAKICESKLEQVF
ncbi:MAG: ATPase, T2SS/T4P/T4SS family [Candidatus Riflebacteria bacterium]|nr:ATPase, T2SS/T4P/T4SS family [Candidatus Riflebacteria bacterium]